MPQTENASLACRLRCICLLCLLAAVAGIASAQSNPESTYFARRNTFGVFAAYSPNSSHILMGNAENRELLDFGVFYSRRLFRNQIVNWQYNGELLPVALESDPLGHFVDQVTSPVVATFSGPLGFAPLSCAPVTVSYRSKDPVTGVVSSGTETISCRGRQWNIGEGISPAGMQWNFLPRHKMQPFFIGHGGYMYSTRQIPTSGAGTFNFTFDLGAGFELYRSRGRSVRAEYRYHHISNHDTASENPGIDNGLIQVTYAFGR